MISGLRPAHLLGHKQLLVLGKGVVTAAHPGAVKASTAAGGLAAGMGCPHCVVCVLVLAAALQDPGALSHDKFEARAGAAAAAVLLTGAGVCGQAVPTHAAGLAADGDALLLALRAAPDPALLLCWCCCCCHAAPGGGWLSAADSRQLRSVLNLGPCFLHAMLHSKADENIYETSAL